MNPKVDFFFIKAKSWEKELKKLRTIVLDCGLTEELKWGNPTYTFDGANIVGSTPNENVSRGLVLCPEGRQIFPDLTVNENLDLGAYHRHSARDASSGLPARQHYLAGFLQRCSMIIF